MKWISNAKDALFNRGKENMDNKNAHGHSHERETEPDLKDVKKGSINRQPEDVNKGAEQAHIRQAGESGNRDVDTLRQDAAANHNQNVLQNVDQLKTIHIAKLVTQRETRQYASMDDKTYFPLTHNAPQDHLPMLLDIYDSHPDKWTHDQVQFMLAHGTGIPEQGVTKKWLESFVKKTNTALTYETRKVTP